ENLKIENRSLEKTRYKKEFFDVITLNHVLEHLSEPYESLSKIKILLKKEGLLIVGVPNSRSLAHFLFKENWYQLDTPRHMINYSDRNLAYVLKKAGFKILKIRY